MKHIYTLLICWICSASLTYGGGDPVSGDKLPVGIDFFANVKSISHLQEHGGTVFFILRQPDLEKDSYRNDLYSLADDGQALRITTSGDVQDYFFLGDDLVFRSIRNEDDRKSVRDGEDLTVFLKLSAGYGEAIEWLRLPYRVREIEAVDDGRIFFTATRRPETDAPEDLHHALEGKEVNDRYRIFDELPFWANGRGDISGTRTHLYLYNKGIVTDLSDTTDNVSSIRLSPDGKRLVYTQQSYRTKAPAANRLFTLDTETLDRQEWQFSAKAVYGNAQFMDGRRLFVTINLSEEHDRQEFSAFYRLDTQTGRFEELYDGRTYAIGNSIGSDIRGAARSDITFDRTGLRYISTVVDRAALVRLDFTGSHVEVLSPEHIGIDEYIPFKDGYLAVAMSGQQGQEICFIDRKQNISTLSRINTELFDTHRIVKPIEITFINDDGLELNGYVLPPADREEGRKYPAILDIHGGPRTAYGTVFFHEMQYWANRGYAVIFTNPTGSSGRGQAFADLRGKFGTADYNDLMRFVDAALEQTDFIDKDRLGVTGGSYGGLMTNWIIGHTDRFKAAVSQRGISSWLTFSNTSDIGHSFTRSYTGTDAWTDSALLWEQSPLKYADKVVTPTLFIHSEQDYRCWLAEGIQMYYALRYFETPARMVIFRNENHELSRSGKPANRIKRLDEITRWFDKYLIRQGE
jgi:dipeptidyl aminopeptidase/acylaminoacyl peptidase